MKRLKENKGMSLIVFTVILAVLVIIAVGVIIYLLNNQKVVGTEVQNPTNIASYNSSNETNLSEEYTNNLIDKASSSKGVEELNINDINNISKILGYVNGLKFKDMSKLSEEELLNTVIAWHYKEDKVEQENVTSAETINKIIKQVYDYSFDYKKTYKWQEATPGIMTYIGINKIKKVTDTYEVEYAIIQLIDADAPDEVWNYYKAIFERNSNEDLYIKSNEKI